MKKSFLKGASIFLASVLTVGMCSAYSVNAKAKFSLPKKTTLSYDKKDNGGNGFYTNVIYIKGTNRSNSESILRNGIKVKSSNKKVISTKTFGKDYYLIADNNQVGIGVKLKKTGSTKITAKFKYRGKTYSVKTTVKVIKYSNPFKKIVVDGRDCTSDFKNKNESSISFMGRNIKITPNKNWRVKSIYTYKPGATKMKKVKGSSVTIPTNCRAFITMENKSYQIMLYNYEHFTYLYANGERFDMTETDRYTVFANSDPINIRLTLSNIPAGSYKISETYVNRKHGSSFDQWVSMGALEPTSLEEYDLLKKASVPGFHQSLTEVSTDGILKLDAQLELLEIRLIQISPVFQ